MSKVRPILDRMLEEYTIWSKARKLHTRRGLGAVRIGTSLGRSTHTIENWLRDTQSKTVGHNIRSKRPLPPLPPSKELLYLAGLYSAGHLARTNKRLEFRNNPRHQTETEKALGKLHIPFHPGVVLGKPATFVGSMHLFDTLEAYTQRQRRVPLFIRRGNKRLSLMERETDIRAFLRGAMTAGGRVMDNAEYIIRLPPGLREAYVLFPRLGLFPNMRLINKGRNVSFEFRGEEAKKLAESNLLDDTQAQALKERVEKMESGRKKIYGLKHFEDAVILRKKFGATPEDIRRILHIPLETLKFWETNVPPAVHRLVDHYEYAKQRGYSTGHFAEWHFALDAALETLGKETTLRWRREEKREGERERNAVA